MSRLRRVSVAFPEEVLADMDALTVETMTRRSDLIREACLLYIENKKRANLREKMKAGYQEMAEINRLLAEELATDFDCVGFPGDGNDLQQDREGSAPSWRKV